MLNINGPIIQPCGTPVMEILYINLIFNNTALNNKRFMYIAPRPLGSIVLSLLLLVHYPIVNVRTPHIF